MLPNVLYEASITLIKQTNKQKQKTKKLKDTTKQYYRPIFLKNIDAKILNKIAANQIQ